MTQTELTISKEGRLFHLIGITGGDDDTTRVRRALEDYQPDHVCVALCQTRLDTLLERDQWLSYDVVQAVRDGHALMLLTSLAMAAYLHRLDHTHPPGAEFAVAVEQARVRGYTVIPIDRDIKITLRRAWRPLGAAAKITLLFNLVRLLWRKQPLPEDHHQRIRTHDSLSAMTAALTQSMPNFVEPLVRERDQMLMHAVEATPGNNVVAIVGLDALQTMADHLDSQPDPTLNRPPKRRPLRTVLAGLTVPLILIGLFLFARHTGSRAPIGDGFGAWVAANLVLVGVFTILSGARKPTVLGAMISSPFSVFLPLLKAGAVAGVIEGRLRKPTVADCERLPIDMLSFKGAMANPITRVLWVFLMTSVGSALGTYVGLFLVFKAWFH